MPKDTLRLADTPLAHWLHGRMSEWTDPDTGVTGLSGNRLADLSGVSQTLIWDILKKGTSQPKADTLVSLAKFFGVAPIHLFRLVYLPESEDDDFSPEVKAKFLELENRLTNVPIAAQLEMLEFLMTQMDMLQVAARLWEREKVVSD